MKVRFVPAFNERVERWNKLYNLITFYLISLNQHTAAL